jgi:D-alanyl-D-alanine dipeptidase
VRDSDAAAGEPADVGAYIQAFNSMHGAYKTLGCLERRARNARSLRDVMTAGGSAA